MANRNAFLAAALVLAAGAALVVPTPALAAANIVVDPVAPTLKETSPGVSTTLAFVVRNTGDASVALTFAAQTASVWTVSVFPTGATVAPGGSQAVTVTVTPQGATVLESAVVLQALDGSTVLATATGAVRVPVFLSEFEQDHKNRTPTHVRGNVTASFLNGASANGASVRFTESLEVFPTNLLPAIGFGPVRQTSSVVGANGEAAYAFPASSTGSTMIGYHRIIAEAAGVVNTDSSLIEHYFWSRT
ncbi:MAG TPA: hypothetical protein VI997_03670 [Candidatus Thermoplasmatota archaeon]|nr:hypothetical protein [Candidatus Thermoplasmatota archaeon]